MTHDQEAMLDECLNAESGLTPWECDFLDSLDQNFRERKLSDKQAEVLERINRKVLHVEGKHEAWKVANTFNSKTVYRPHRR